MNFIKKLKLINLNHKFHPSIEIWKSKIKNKFNIIKNFNELYDIGSEVFFNGYFILIPTNKFVFHIKISFFKKKQNKKL